MRTTLNLDEKLVKKAMEYTGILEKTALLHAGLEALVQKQAALRLAALGGKFPKTKAAKRRRESKVA